VKAVSVPVTLKIRTGYTREHKNAVAVARIAEASGIAALAVHGRTRADLYQGDAEYDTIAAVKQAVKIPVLANGDIDTPAKALRVLQHTGADGVMVGRGAFGRPWIFNEIAHHFSCGQHLDPPGFGQIGTWVIEHLDALYAFYGEQHGVRMARKHIQRYFRNLRGGAGFWSSVNLIADAAEQRRRVERFFEVSAQPKAA
jgi:tRNA-dihydrouridine synthase B